MKNYYYSLAILFGITYWFNSETHPPIKRVDNTLIDKTKVKSEHTESVKINKAYILNRSETEKYIDEFSLIAVAEYHRTGILASIKIAQAILESNRGKSKLSSQYNNHFGIKCWSKNCKKGHCMNYHDDSHKDFFKVYESAVESFKDHSEFLSKERYKGLKEYGSDYKKWAYGLKKAGYATSESYPKDLIRIIQKYDLDKFDNI